MSFASPSGEERKNFVKIFFPFGLREMGDESRAVMRIKPRRRGGTKNKNKLIK